MRPMRPIPLHLESLDDRVVPATLDVSGGVLAAVGDSSADAFTLSISGTTLKVTNPGHVFTSVPAGFRGVGTATATGPSTGITSIVVDGADGDDVLNVQSCAVPVSLIGGNGADTANVCGNAPANTTTVDGIIGGVYVDAEQLNVSDFGATSGNSNVVIGSGAITGLAPASITFGSIAGLYVRGSNSSGLAETFTLNGGSPPMLLECGAGATSLSVLADTTADITGGSAADYWYVAPSVTLTGYIHGGFGGDTFDIFGTVTGGYS